MLPAQARLLSPVLPPAAQRTGSIKVSPCLSCHPGLAGAVGTREAPPTPYCSGSGLHDSCRAFQSQGPVPSPVPSLGSHLHDNSRNVRPGLVWRPRSCNFRLCSLGRAGPGAGTGAELVCSGPGGVSPVEWDMCGSGRDHIKAPGGQAGWGPQIICCLPKEEKLLHLR